METNISSRPSVAIYCTTLELGKEPFSSEYYWEAYEDLLLELKNRGLEAYFVTGADAYLGNGRFQTAYTTNMKTLPDRLTKVHNIQVDLVFDRAESAGFDAADVAVINPVDIRRIANDKIEMYRHFGALQPESRIVHNPKQLQKTIDVFAGDNVVVKEPVGSGGRKVYIGSKADVLRQAPANTFPLLVQQFLDTSVGVPGYSSGVHDVRLSVCGGRIIGYYIRIAKTGSLHSNVSQGGHMEFLSVSDVPAEVRDMVSAIDREFAPAPRYYAADFVHSDQGWKMIELNPYLALLPFHEGEEAVKTAMALADYLERTTITEAIARLRGEMLAGQGSSN